MNTKALCIITILSGFLMFLGNRSAARNGCAGDLPGCEKCRCKVTMKAKSTDFKKGASCSVVFSPKFRETMKETVPDDFLVQDLKSNDVVDKISFNACGFTLYCDKEASAEVSCRDELEKPIFDPSYSWKTTNIWGNQKCKTTCEYRGGAKVFGVKIQDSERTTNTSCSKWERPAPPTKPVKKPIKKPPVKKPGLSFTNMFASDLDGGSWPEFINTLMLPVVDDAPDASPARESKPVQAGPLDPNITITDSTLWKLLDGEGGMEQGTLILTEGEAKAHSFCTGDTVRVSAPNMMTMPNCPQYVVGHWDGAFARPRPKNAPATTPRVPVPMTLELRNAKGSLTGELKTNDGVYTVTGSQSGANIGLEAARPGTRAKISLQGTVTKDSIVFGGSEETADGIGTYGLVGFFRQMFVADSALPPAIVNMPYSFALTAFAPGGEALSFRLAAAKPPERSAPRTTSHTQKEINWFTNAEDLRGRNGERFKFLCPANGSFSGYLYGTDVYSDSSAICKAAVHAGRITREAGGTITIEIRPNAPAYPATNRNGVLSSTYSYGTGKGSFVFASGEPVKAEMETVKPVESAQLPNGVSFDPATGIFSGTPTELGAFELTVVAEDGAGNVFEQPLTLIVRKMALTNALLHDGFVGEPYSAALSVMGGQPPYRFSATLPRGLQIDPSTGEINGTPASPMPFAAFNVTVRDSQNNTETQKVVMSVRGATILGSHYLPDASVGEPYRTQFRATGSLSPVRWKAYPTNISLIGLTLNEQTGELFGTPTKAGSFLIQIRAEAGGSVGRSFTLTVE